MKDRVVYDGWLIANAEVFWGEIARSDHVLQIYDNDGVFIDAVTGFVQAAINADETAIVTATEPHLNALERRLEAYGLDIEELISRHKFIPINVEELVGEFIGSEVDEAFFSKVNASFFQKLGNIPGKFRVCGELAPQLLKHGWKEAAVNIEELTDQHNHANPACLFCAYPKKLLNRDINRVTSKICKAHSKIISGSEKQLTHVVYKPVLQEA
jgi:hypothetical protein